MQFNLQIKGLDRALIMLDEKKVRRAARMAINDGLTAGRKTASQQIRKDWNIKAARVNKELRKFKTARNNDLTAILQAKGAPISLVHFGAKWKRGRMTTTGTKSTMSKRASKSGGVTVKIHRGKTTRLPHAFIATTTAGRSGIHIGVFERMPGTRMASNPKKEKLKSMATITLASMLDQPKVMRPTLHQIDARINKRFDHHLTRLLK